MSGCECRQSNSMFIRFPNKYLLKKGLFKYLWRYLKWLFSLSTLKDKLFWEDSFCPFVCRLIGHELYLDKMCDEPICKRCHKFVTMK